MPWPEVLTCASPSHDARTPDEVAGWPQDDLHTLVPYLIAALAECQSRRPAVAGRLRAAVVQLLTPLLDSLHAYRLSVLSRGEPGLMRLETLSAVLVGPGITCAGARASAPCLSPLHKAKVCQCPA